MNPPYAAARSIARDATGLRANALALPTLRALLGVAAVTAYSLAPANFSGVTSRALGALDEGVALFIGALLVLATLWLVEARAASRSGPWLAFGAAFVAALTMLDASRPAAAATWVCAAALLLALEREANPLVPAALTVVWCNLSPDGLLAPALALAFALGRVLEAAYAPRTKKALAAAAACAVATLATPALVGYWLRGWAALHLDRDLAAVTSLHPVDVAPDAYRIGFLAIVVVAAVAGPIRRSSSDALLFALAVLLALANGAFLPLLGIVVAPILAAAAVRTRSSTAALRASAQEDSPARRMRAGAVAFAAPALGVAALLAFGSPVQTLAQRATAAHPLELIAPLAGSASSHRLLCTTLAWCDAAAAFDGVPVLLDSRTETFPASAFGAQATIVRTRAHWERALRVSGVDVVLAGRREPLGSLLQLRGWKVVVSDDRALLLERAR